MIGRILRAIDIVSIGAEWVGAVSLFVMATLLLAEVFCRDLLNFGLSFSWEYAAYMMAFTFTATAARTLRVGGHVRVSAFQVSFVPETVRYLIDLAATLGAVAISLFVTWSLTDYSWQSFIRGARTFLPSETPLWWPQAVMTLGVAILTAQLMARVVRLLMHEKPEIDLGGDSLTEKEL